MAGPVVRWMSRTARRLAELPLRAVISILLSPRAWPDHQPNWAQSDGCAPFLGRAPVAVTFEVG
jgi:hypothetical protein